MKRFLNLIVYILTVHVFALLLTGIFRGVLYIWFCRQLPESDFSGFLIPAFVRGLWFDNVIGCYILLLPLVVGILAALFDYYGKILFRFLTVFFSFFYTLVFLISAADIPYFGYFFKHINSSIFEWFEYAGTTAGMVLGEKSYYVAIAFFLLSLAVFIYFQLRLSRVFRLRCNLPETYSWRSGLSVALSGCVLLGLCLFGIRGRTGYNPIKVSAAYFCGNAFMNQLGVSPTFNLMTSIMDDMRPENKYFHVMDEEEAVRNVQRFLNRKGTPGISPLAVYRTNSTDSVNRKRPNVVLIMMESMSVKWMRRFGQKAVLTPFLDSLYKESLAFSNFYSAGIHTNHGLYATLYSFPAIMKRNLMKGTVIPKYSGLPTVLKENGYHNLFFMTHEGQYDNMNAFFRTNGFDRVFAQEDYPPEKVVNSFGVQDDFLYSYAIPVLTEQSKTGQPFFATILSISNHPPYVIPSYFQPKTGEAETQIVEYADWALRNFFEEARKQPWFENTIFVLEGDHGKMVGDAECELPESYNHIPLMIYAPDTEPCEYDCYGGQIDVQATVLGLLGIDYMQNDFGVNLLKEKRPCMFYTADDMIAARDAKSLYIYNYETEQEFTYRIEGDKLMPVPSDENFLFLKVYGFSMLQAAEYLVKHGKTVTTRPDTD